ncbi:GST-C-6 domain-containing protein [Favolaschia claudopus]|uniref:GST-C-6 domain-containing protein n=1 Tax=Favolaschia claudopus TaxID=2862362 RepID=A0AAW0CJ22_9AGAR
MSIPAPIAQLFSHFPLHTFPPISPSSGRHPHTPTLWIQSPRSDSSRLSADVECLKWQAYLALRGLSQIAVRCDIAPEGAMGGRLPNLHLANGQLLPAQLIPTWADETLQEEERPLEGYKDQAALDESRAWVSLLEGDVHSALLIAQPTPSYLSSLLAFPQTPFRPLESIVLPPPPPLSGLTSLIRPYGLRVDRKHIESKYHDAISAIADRLGTDKWFLGSAEATPLDALIFAYLHSVLHTANHIVRVEVTRRVNLVAWELRVRGLVSAAFSRP